MDLFGAACGLPTQRRLPAAQRPDRTPPRSLKELSQLLESVLFASGVLGVVVDAAGALPPL
jgi:hypothetical protein